MELEGVISEYSKEFVPLEYDLPKFWQERDRHGLYVDQASMPLSSKMANFVMNTINADAFPWGYIYGLLDIDDPEKKYITGPETLLQMIMMNMSAIIPACILFITIVAFPGLIIITWIFRAVGECGGRIKPYDLLSQKKRYKWLYCALLFGTTMAIVAGAIEFYHNISPLTETLPHVIEKVVVYTITDFNTYFHACIRELRYFLDLGMMKLLDGAINTLTKEFWDMVNEILSKVQFENFGNITLSLQDTKSDISNLKTLLSNATDLVEPLNLATTGITTSVLLLRSSIRNMNKKCAGYNQLVQSVICTGIPNANSIPDLPAGFDVSFDMEGINRKVDSVDIDGMIEGLDKFNESVVINLSNKSIPVEMIKNMINEQTAGIRSSFDFESLNPLNDELLDSIIEKVKYYLHHQLFTTIGHLARLLGLIPILYVILVIGATLLGIYATHDQRFPCVHRSPAAGLSASVLSKSQIIPLLFHPIFAAICGILIALMSLVSPFIHSLYTKDILIRVIDRVPMSKFNREIVLPITAGQDVTTVVFADRMLKTCRRNGGGLKAVGLNVGDLKNLTNLLDVIPWPDIAEFKDKLETGLEFLEDSVIPTHGDVESLHNRINQITLPIVDFSGLRHMIQRFQYLDINGRNITFNQLAQEFTDKASTLKQVGSQEANDIAQELEAATISIRNIEQDISIILSKLTPLEDLYGPLNDTISILKGKLVSLIDDFVVLGMKVKAVAEDFLRTIDVDYKAMLNRIKLSLRKVIFIMIDFLLDNLFRCRIFYDMYEVITELAYLYTISYLNGLWLSSVGICVWWFTAIFCWKLSSFFQPVRDLKNTASKERFNGTDFDKLPNIEGESKVPPATEAPKTST